MNEEQMRSLLRRECEKAGDQKAWALANHMSGAYVTDVLRGRRTPGEKMLAALGLERVVSYRKVRRNG